MKRIIRITAVLTLAAVILSGFAGCSDSKNDGGAEISVSDASAELSSAPEETSTVESAWKKLEAVDYEGAGFNILAFNSAALAKWLVTEGENGDIFNDTVYARKRAVEELYNVVIGTYNSGDETAAMKKLQNDVMSGSGEFDVSYQWAMKLPSAVESGSLYNILDVGQIDTTAPWWNQDSVDAFELVKGKLYYASNAINVSNVDGAGGILFSSGIIEDYNLGDPYQLVYDGAWTLDKMYSMMSAVTSDLDGSETRTVNDMYGITAAWGQIMNVYSGCGFKLADITRDGEDIAIDVAFDGDREIEVAQWLNKVIGDTNMTANMNDDSWAYDAFYTGHSLFYMSGIGSITELRTAMESDFGILPGPKFDESQAEYYASSGGRNTPLFSISAATSDIGRTGTIVEAMAIYSYENLIDAYLDVTLVGKCARDENTEAMLNLIISRITYDVGFLTVPALFDRWYPAVSDGGAATLSSTAESIRENVSKSFADYIEAVKNAA